MEGGGSVGTGMATPPRRGGGGVEQDLSPGIRQNVWRIRRGKEG